MMTTENAKRSIKKVSSLPQKMRDIIRDDPSIPAKFSPYLKDETAWVIPAESFHTDLEMGDDGLPVPPQRLWYGHWKTSADYLASGRDRFKSMMNILSACGFLLEESKRVLDFGCGAGRIIRCFKQCLTNPLTCYYEVWGVDIDAERILWCQQHLSPPFKFITTTTFPHLPFEDNYFDIIYAGAVFTHIADLVEAWLLELKRILRPGGRCYITVCDNHSIELILSFPPDHWLYHSPMRQQLLALEEENRFSSSGFSMLVTSRDPSNAKVFYDIDFLRKSWGNLFEIVCINPEAFGYQTAITLRK